MGKITSKLQVTVPKAVAVAYGLKPGDDLAFEPAGDVIRLHPGGAPGRSSGALTLDQRLSLFDGATRRQAGRNRRFGAAVATGRGWRREDLYTRGMAR